MCKEHPALNPITDPHARPRATITHPSYFVRTPASKAYAACTSDHCGVTW